MKKFFVFFIVIAVFLVVVVVVPDIAEARRYYRGGHGSGAPCLFLGIGAALGLIGGAAIATGMADKDEQPCCPSNNQEPPRGRWVEIPGRWDRGAWVPAHREWQPY